VGDVRHGCRVFVLRCTLVLVRFAALVLVLVLVLVLLLVLLVLLKLLAGDHAPWL
jgi:hypothetical protein